VSKVIDYELSVLPQIEVPDTPLPPLPAGTVWKSETLLPGRVETKFAVSEELAGQVWEASRQYLPADRGIYKTQRITSLYLDAPALTFLRWHKEGRSARFKLRVRGYGDPVGDRVFLEIKRKEGSTVYKQRAEVSTATLTRVLGDSFTAHPGCPNLQDFMKIRHQFQAEPKVLVSCLREALRETGPSGETAVTIDRRISFQPTRRRDLDGEPGAWRSATLPGVTGLETSIVELKYTEEPPAWMKALIVRLAPYRVSFSKYRAAMQQHLVM